MKIRDRACHRPRLQPVKPPIRGQPVPAHGQTSGGWLETVDTATVARISKTAAAIAGKTERRPARRDERSFPTARATRAAGQVPRVIGPPKNGVVRFEH